MRSLVALLLGIGLSACTVGVADDNASSGPAIACTDDHQCAPGMTCESGYCRGRTAISNVLLTVAMPESVNLAQYSNTSFVLPLEIPPSGQADITLPALETIAIDTNLVPLALQKAGCDYSRDDPSRAITIQLSHSWPVQGLESILSRQADDLPASFSGLPIDAEYEVYLSLSDAFQSALSADCAVPPVLFRDVAVGSAGSVTLDWPVARLARVDIQVPSVGATGASSLSGWQLDVVDPVAERELALPVTLGAAVADGTDSKLVHYPATIAYNPLASAGSSPPSGTELLRLRPPADRAAPTYYATLSSLSLFVSNGVTVLPLSGVPEQVTLTGRVEGARDLQPIAKSKITFTSTGFSVGNEGLSAKFHVSADSDAAGQFQVTLPSGQYLVVAEPPNDGEHASLEASWSIQAAPPIQAGRLLALPPLSMLSGSVDNSVKWGASSSASVQITPSSRILADQVTGAVTLRQTSPGARAAQMLFEPAQNSEFELLSDLGTFDISLRPPAGLPWIVTPGFVISTEQQTLRQWTMPVPAYWTGHLRVPLADGEDNSNLGDLPRAVLRVFVLVDASGTVVQATADADSIVEIAETRAGADGSFSLVLPNQLQGQ